MTERVALDVLGYRTIGGGGITNQKIAFIGLLLEAYESKRPVVLPYFRVMDQVERHHRKIDFEEVFEIEAIREFCSRYGIVLTQVDFEQLPEGYDSYFWKIHHILQNAADDPEDKDRVFVLDVLRSLVPRVRTAFLTRMLRDTVAGLDPDFVVAQFRIEADSQEHCRSNLDLVVPEHEVNFLAFEDILTKIRNTLPDVKSLFVLCDEKALPVSKEEMKEKSRDYFGFHLMFKSDYLSRFEERLYTELHLSLIDFELATFSERFVGITRSTFSCLATLEKSAREGRSVRNHYIYNLPGRRLIERTDNGIYWDAASAVKWTGTAGANNS